MFNWPRTIEGRGVITVTARHWTPGSEALGEWLANAMCVLTMVGCGGAFYYYHTYRGQRVDVGGLIFVSCIVGVFAVFPGAVVMGLTKVFCKLFVRPRTTVRITVDTVEVAGISYSRDAAAIQFTNLYPHQVQMSHAGGEQTMLGSLEETAGLRMFYGANAILITTFKSVQKAGRFALACNAALGRVATPAVRGFPVIPVAELYRGDDVSNAMGQGRPALPPPGTIRRR